jgi:hypothetical protein
MDDKDFIELDISGRRMWTLLAVGFLVLLLGSLLVSPILRQTDSQPDRLRRNDGTGGQFVAMRCQDLLTHARLLPRGDARQTYYAAVRRA